LGFLGASPFRRKSPDLEHWIPLDFLGFSRPNRDLSMGYEGFSPEDFSRRFRPAAARGAQQAAAVETMAKRALLHGKTLTLFLILCN
jgi:hypothetical protein